MCAGCPKRGERSPAESADRLAELYEPVGLELLPGTEPVGTRHADRYDQLRVILALHDHQKDRTRGFGQFRFEIYEYRPASADRRGERWGVWNVPIESHKDLDEHWDPFNRMFEFRLDFQNEFTVGWLDGEPRVTVPDLICVMDATTGDAIGTETLRYGQRVRVVALRAPELQTTPKGLEHVGPRAFGYDLDFRSVFQGDPVPGERPVGREGQP